jgi:predicted glycosyltransferase
LGIKKERKKIWVDVLTPKQALFAKAMIERAPSDFEIIVTTRDYSELNNFAEDLELKHISFGKHGGAVTEKKLVASIERMEALVSFVKRSKFDCSLSFISPEAARISFGLAIKHCICSDSPHAIAAARLSVPLADKLFSPFPIKKSRWTQYGIKPSQVFYYHALDPWAWLIDKYEVLSKRKLSSSNRVLIRLEESFASYVKHGKGISDILGKLILVIKSAGDFEIVVIPRYEEQRNWAKRKFGKAATVPETTIAGTEMISSAELVIGGGGTMTQEAALLGVPNISYFPSSHLDVFENYYFPKKLSIRAAKPSELLKQTYRMLSMITPLKDQFSSRARNAVRTFEDPIKFIFSEILKD